MEKFKLLISITLFFALSIFTVSANTVITVYKTYEDYQNKIGEKYDKYDGYIHSLGKVKLYLYKNGVKTKVKCADIWGFTYNTELFRIYKKDAQPVRVINNGSIIYYENGVAHLEMLATNSKSAELYVGYYCFLSKGINTPIIPMPGVWTITGYAKKQVKKFRKEYPEYSDLFDCIDENYRYTKMRVCVQIYGK
ncbi:hypothetical protein KFE94_01970 [bacterium SCSIO 12643]|nr:hypothetical protein KFE94_01970 [bacterium SCSIO 12643]